MPYSVPLPLCRAKKRQHRTPLHCAAKCSPVAKPDNDQSTETFNYKNWRNVSSQIRCQLWITQLAFPLSRGQFPSVPNPVEITQHQLWPCGQEVISWWTWRISQARCVHNSQNWRSEDTFYNHIFHKNKTAKIKMLHTFFSTKTTRSAVVPTTTNQFCTK